MTFIEKTDRITIDDLRRTGATKWAVQDDLIGAFVAEMDFGIAPVITKALHEIVDQGAFGYLPTRFTAELRAATAQMLQSRHGWTVEPADVRVVPDVIKALELAIEHHSRAGSKIIVPTPSYMPFLSIPPMMGREVIEVPMRYEDGHYALDMAGIQEAFDQGGNLLILCNPYNPVGRVFSRAELEAVAELVERNGGRVFSDEIWAPLTYAGNRHLPYASVNEVAAGHAITALSASKAWNLPGLKCAQVITSNDADRAIWNKIGFFAAHGTANLGVVANAVAYREGFPWLEDVVAYLDRNRRAMADLVHDLLPGVRYHIPEGTYVGWLDFRGSAVADNPGAFFKEKAGVYLTEGVTCGKDFAGFARFIFATPLPIMQEAMDRMSKAMKAL
ncbi:cystathionine beta-lyase [Sphingobium sp. B7D2B]|uniref:MalY/PatB family protein n=1 Tax=Sphingobium sp. B7D2B TaxID=2940583 RepID=UPI002224B728|nr:aminotransferase class I/II-fold pyridoxal phosphate-dependent enzyme [Sphingobium sp. B7D2B]MCW2365091.1 cystathionine beta-lyase [Sphingobium sp. B7D2B]